MKTLAVVSTQGAINFCCFPHFDSPSMFCSILDRKKGGHWRIFGGPNEDIRNVKQTYWPDTNMLITKIFSTHGIGQVIDYMPVDKNPKKRSKLNCIVRQVSIRSGFEFQFRMEFLPAMDFARRRHRLEFSDQGKNITISNVNDGGDPFQFELKSSLPLSESDLSHGDMELLGDGVVKNFVVKHRETVTFILCCENEQYRRVELEEEESLYYKTIEYWRKWIDTCTYSGRWLEMVHRSALALKLLTFEQTGAIIAAGTTSLPETLGGPRNWDYRYVWIRDASFTVYALLRLGFTQETEDFMNFLEKIISQEQQESCLQDKSVHIGPLQVMYKIDGSREIPEEKLHHLEGYMGSGPVRVGNEAYGQRQLDIYGELVDGIYLYNKYAAPLSYDMWTNVRSIIDWVCDNWRLKDDGIWEMRVKKQHNVYSKVMCWVAVDRGLRLADKRSFPLPQRTRWLETRDEIFEDIMTNGWSHERQAFVQFYGSNTLDASTLMMPLCLFLSSNDPRMVSTFNAIRKPTHEGGLLKNSLVFRYDSKLTDDGIEFPENKEREEGTFNICSFWFIECLTRLGVHDRPALQEARFKLEDMFSYANHVGLYSEQTSATGRHLGNFPQAFTHISLISSAFNLDRAFHRLKRGVAPPP